MQAYAEGFDLFDKSRVRARQREDRAPLDAGLGRALVAAASWPRARSRRRATTSRDLERLRRGLRRGPLDDRGRDRPATCPTPVITAVAVRALLLARQRRLRRPRCSRRCATSSAATRSRRAAERRPTREPTAADGRAQPRTRSSRGSSGCRSTRRRWSIFGATGDLAQPQAAAGALQPRPRGRAARALQPDRRLAPRQAARGLPRRWRARRSSSSRAASPTPTVLDALLGERALRAGHVRRRRRSTSELDADARRVRRARPGSRSTASSTSRPRRSSSR